MIAPARDTRSRRDRAGDGSDGWFLAAAILTCPACSPPRGASAHRLFVQYPPNWEHASLTCGYVRVRAMRRPPAPVSRPAALMLSSVVAALAALGAFTATAQAGSRGATHIVQLREGVSLAEGGALIRATGGRVAGGVPIIRGVGARLPRGTVAALERDDRVKAVSVNAAVRSLATPVDASRLATAYPYAANAPPGWHSATGDGVGVAVIDTGIDGGLPDFVGADGRSRVVAAAVTNPDATTAADTYGHGTHVAGIIAGDGTRRAAVDPVAGKYIGTAPRAMLVEIKASDDTDRGTVLHDIFCFQCGVDHREDYN